MIIVPEEIISETEKRVSERKHIREEHRKKIRRRDWLAADTPKRVEKRLKRLGVTEEEVEDPIFLERMFGENDLVDMSFLEMGLWVARSVGRILYQTAAGHSSAEATGFMVSPRLLLTNNHVLTSSESASRFLVEFNYQIGLDGNLLPSMRFELQPDTFFVTDKSLDYSLVAVSPNATDGSDLGAFGWNRLIEE